MIDFQRNRELSDIWCDSRGRLHRTGQYRITKEIKPVPSKIPTRLWMTPLTGWSRIFRFLRGNWRKIR